MEATRGMDTGTAPTELAAWDAECIEIMPAFRGRRPFPKWEARAWRIRGEIAEQSGDRQSASSCYAAALDLDPNVGVKRRIKGLQA